MIFTETELTAKEKELRDLIELAIAPDIMKQHNLSVEKIVQDTFNTKENFQLDGDPVYILAGEIPYYIRYGMNAFDSGYLRKYIKS